MLRRDKNPLESETNSFTAYKEIYASVFAVRMEKSVNKLQIQPKLGQLKAAWTGYPTPINNLSVEIHTQHRVKVWNLIWLDFFVQSEGFSCWNIKKKPSILSTRSVETETDIKLLTAAIIRSRRTINHKINKLSKISFLFSVSSLSSLLNRKSEVIVIEMSRDLPQVPPNDTTVTLQRVTSDCWCSR